SPNVSPSGSARRWPARSARSWRRGSSAFAELGGRDLARLLGKQQEYRRSSFELRRLLAPCRNGSRVHRFRFQGQIRGDAHERSRGESAQHRRQSALVAIGRLDEYLSLPEAPRLALELLQHRSELCRADWQVSVENEAL